MYGKSNSLGWTLSEYLQLSSGSAFLSWDFTSLDI